MRRKGELEGILMLVSEDDGSLSSSFLLFSFRGGVWEWTRLIRGNKRHIARAFISSRTGCLGDRVGREVMLVRGGRRGL